MNEFPRLRARIDATETAAQQLAEQVKQLENVVIRLAEQINLMQKKHKPGRPRKAESNEN
jgi:phage shock protein A